MSRQEAALSPRASRLAAALAAAPRRVVKLADLWQILDLVDPVAATSPTRRADLAALLAELQAAGVIAVPSPRSLDRAQHPPLPRRVTFSDQTTTGPDRDAAGSANSVAWRPELAWAAASGARLSAGQIEILRQVNAWLRDGQPTADVPLRERSYEIFGDEKQLDRLLGTSLFGAGRLSLRLLRARRTHPPLPARRLGNGPALLVVENSDTFDTLASLLTEQPGRVGWIAWGAGRAFESSVVSVGELPKVTETRYYGDLDPAGLRIPASASRLAADEGLPLVQPASSLYRVLLTHGVPQPAAAQNRLELARAAALASWLPPDFQEEVTELLVSGHRLPQEAVSFEVLARSQSWRGPFR